ncbi:hypothetical protein OG562_12090 [Streptomyces sp. NBC_01275]|uniref:hypothetical protein n=1 Tax=Streptomyces sp. NBC_01275 TaxID=2903807 RepID=UPI00224D3BDF|nr:hypothetical protein [Streptomyces sp. NBC_01275]MCX4761704.1 hypothetical protein [Streptomyces sp. NBC_01275]
MELSPEAKAFEESARRGGDPREVAVGVCVGLGIPRGEAERRVRELESVFAELGPEEGELAFLLDLGDLFVVDRRLDADEVVIRDLLVRAGEAMGDGVPSGVAKGLSRWFRTGELDRAFLLLADERRRVRPEGDPSAYWAALVAAGELLLPGGDHQGVGEALAYCRRMAAQYPAPARPAPPLPHVTEYC